jgi:hypothetical protein
MQGKQGVTDVGIIAQENVENSVFIRRNFKHFHKKLFFPLLFHAHSNKYLKYVENEKQR